MFGLKSVRCPQLLDKTSSSFLVLVLVLVVVVVAVVVVVVVVVQTSRSEIDPKLSEICKLHG